MSKATWTFYVNPFKTTIATVTNFTNESKQTMLHLRICILHSTWSSTLVTTIWNAGNLADGFSVWSQAAMLAQKCSGLGQLHWVSNSELRLIFEVRIKNWPKTPTTAGTNVLFMGFLWGGLIFQESKVYTVAIRFLWCSMLYSFGSGIEHMISSRFHGLDERASLHSWEGAMLGAYLLEQTKPTSSQIWSLDSLQVVPQDLGSNTRWSRRLALKCSSLWQPIDS